MFILDKDECRPKRIFFGKSQPWRLLGLLQSATSMLSYSVQLLRWTSTSISPLIWIASPLFVDGLAVVQCWCFPVPKFLVGFVADDGHAAPVATSIRNSLPLMSAKVEIGLICDTYSVSGSWLSSLCNLCVSRLMLLLAFAPAMWPGFS